MAEVTHLVRRATIALTASALALLCMSASGQRLTEWTEEPGELGLGYPVPVPVDTPLPFDGFRSYQGLHARHQSLMMESPMVEGHVVGQTRGGRDIWAYTIGDQNPLDITGAPKPALMIQGGIHAREWQTPEVVTGVMEKLVDNQSDQYLHQYLLENTNLVMIPVLNIDGFLQTQRYPTANYLGTDINNPNGAPRDGRMRRKNMNGVDEDLATTGDHLLGIDLNRNNPPFWATSSGSSADSRSLVHHGQDAHSEPETQAMRDAALLGPEDRLRIFTDVHSFSQVFFSERTGNVRRDVIQGRLLSDLTQHHVNLTGNKFYFNQPSTSGNGIGSTDEYFAYTYQIPSWTLEIEPSSGSHSGLPGNGADYGGLATNGHDGFILPESQIRRVRDNWAETFMVAYYIQAGPPSVARVRIVDLDQQVTIYDAEWDTLSGTERRLNTEALAPLVGGRAYELIVSFDKPMRWRAAGDVAPLPGQSSFNLRVTTDFLTESAPLELTVLNESWSNADGEFYRYRDDTFRRQFSLPADTAAQTLVLDLFTTDMVGEALDANPATVLDWSDGHWIRYENNGTVETDSGGHDLTLTVEAGEDAAQAFLPEAGNTAAYFDPDHAGEGFLLEVLPGDSAVIYWFTYDEAGNQRWFVGVGEIVGNEVQFSELLQTRGGQFGDAFDPTAIVREPVGNLTLRFSGCDAASVRFGADRKTFRQRLVRLTTTDGLPCGADQQRPASVVTGSWYDPDHAGEGFIVQQLSTTEALVYWFSYDSAGNQAWFFGTGTLLNGVVTVAAVQRTEGGIFGDDFDPEDVTLSPWGSLTLTLGCDSGSAEYSSSIDEFGAGSQDLVRLTTPEGVAGC